MRIFLFVCLIAAFCGHTPIVWAQEKTDASAQSAGVKLGKTSKQVWKIGVIVSAGDGAAQGIVATTTVPMDWPEQRVRIVGKDVSPNVNRISYKTLDGGARQMVISISRLAAREQATAIVSFEVTRSEIAEPDDTRAFVVSETLPAKLRKFLLPSPSIDSTNARVRELAEKIVTGHKEPWKQVGAVYDWVQTNVRYQVSDSVKSSVEALEDRVGDCEELSSLFIALCRANKIPARTVRVPGHSYAEFCLHDTNGNAHWIPCDLATNQRELGWRNDPRPILQKGDNFRVNGKSVRYLGAELRARNAAAPLRIEPVMKEMPLKE